MKTLKNISKGCLYKTKWQQDGRYYLRKNCLFGLTSMLLKTNVKYGVLFVLLLFVETF